MNLLKVKAIAIRAAAWPDDFMTILIKSKPLEFKNGNATIRAMYEGAFTASIHKEIGRKPTPYEQFTVKVKPGSLKTDGPDALAQFIEDCQGAAYAAGYRRVKVPSQLKPKTFLIGKTSTHLFIYAMH